MTDEARETAEKHSDVNKYREGSHPWCKAMEKIEPFLAGAAWQKERDANWEQQARLSMENEFRLSAENKQLQSEAAQLSSDLQSSRAENSALREALEGAASVAMQLGVRVMGKNWTSKAINHAIEALSSDAGKRAHEKWKAMEKVCELSRSLVCYCYVQEPHKSGCPTNQIRQALADLDALEKGER
jgi:hypothetical protein